MRCRTFWAFAALALPLASTAAVAAPLGAPTGGALTKMEQRQVIDVRKGGGHHGFRGGGFRGGHAFRGGGGGPRIAGFRGRHWHGGHHHHFHRHRFGPRWYGAPYYYGNYYPDTYYYDDYYYDDGPDETVIYSDSGDAVARCAARYRSFDRASGTFLSNEGVRKLCPYLR